MKLSMHWSAIIIFAIFLALCTVSLFSPQEEESAVERSLKKKSTATARNKTLTSIGSVSSSNPSGVEPLSSFIRIQPKKQIAQRERSDMTKEEISVGSQPSKPHHTIAQTDENSSIDHTKEEEDLSLNVGRVSSNQPPSTNSSQDTSQIDKPHDIKNFVQKNEKITVTSDKHKKIFNTIESSVSHINPSRWQFQPQHGFHQNIVLLSGSVAVLFGAFSARHFIKKRHPLSMFIVDVDSMEDELAYDIAYTTSVSEIGYGSFSSTSLSDLEKFDI